ncbi:MAG TPA: hypothetical protein VGR07_13665, partial [Thermoanaerobaculia bacterium]|nr:hypothetical protein [Thermoanaerobaculia bacterium]
SVGVFYGAVARFFFGYKLPWGPVFTVMSVSFLFLVPLVLGFLVVYVGEGEGPPWGWWRWIVTPWVAALLALGGALALAWEGIICVFLWIPVFLTMSSLGGVAASLVRRLGRPSGTRPYVLVFSLLLPFALAPLEHRLPLPTERREVRTAIAIDAPVETVWKNIERVPKIEPQEQRWSLFHAIGFPRPVEATLSREGVGGVRHATFERGVLFVETITDWQPGRRLAFSIHADPTSIPPTTLDEHVTVGGPFFDVLEGVYEIEPVAPGRVILHLASTHRLSTHFNAYSGLWTDLILRNVQEYILEILKRRCEAAPA